MQGICGTPIVNGKIWTKNFGLKNQFPYCKNPSNKCLAAAGGIGNINTPYYRTPAPGEKGCGRDGCGEGFEFIAGIIKPPEGGNPPPQAPLSITGYLPAGVRGVPFTEGSIISNSISENIIGFVNVIWGAGPGGGVLPGLQTLIFAKSELKGKSIQICRNGSIIKELKLGDVLTLNIQGNPLIEFCEPVDSLYYGYCFYVAEGGRSELGVLDGSATPNAITIIPGQRYTIIE
jgi:hypothetical protein